MSAMPSYGRLKPGTDALEGVEAAEGPLSAARGERDTLPTASTTAISRHRRFLETGFETPSCLRLLPSC